MSKINLNTKKKKYLNTTGRVNLFISEIRTLSKNGTTIIVLKCETVNEEHYDKEFSLSFEGQPHLAEFVLKTEMLTEKDLTEFESKMIIGKSFSLDFIQKKNKKYPLESEKEFYMIEKKNSAQPIKLS